MLCSLNIDLFTYKELIFKHYGDHRCIKQCLIMSFQSRGGATFTNNNTKQKRNCFFKGWDHNHQWRR